MSRRSYQVQTNNDHELLRRYRSAKPLRRELLLLGMAAVTFFLFYLDITLYPSTNLLGLGWGLLIGAVVSYTVRLSRR
jgi:Ca2+/Na+ antiporter